MAIVSNVSRPTNTSSNSILVGGNKKPVIAANAVAATRSEANISSKTFNYSKSLTARLAKAKGYTSSSSSISASQASSIVAVEANSYIYDNKTFGYQPEFLMDSPTLEGAPEGTGVSSSVIDSVARSHNLANRISSNWYERFSRNGIVDPFTAHTSSKEYIFITKPDLNLYSGNGTPNPELSNRSSFFKDALDRYKDVAKQLQFSYHGPSRGPFMPILSNAFTGHLDIPTLSADTFDTANNAHGVHMFYRGTSIDSDTYPEVNIEFKDNKYLEVYMLLKMYDEYERMKWQGLVTPPSSLYVYRKILHDQVSMYKIVVGDDGMTIKYWARWTGGTITSIPRDYFGDFADGEITLNTTWKFHFFSDMDPVILTDFNRITAGSRSGKSICPLYNLDGHCANPVWPTTPSIFVNKGTNKEDKYNKYFLMWYN